MNRAAHLLLVRQARSDAAQHRCSRLGPAPTYAFHFHALCAPAGSSEALLSGQRPPFALLVSPLQAGEGAGAGERATGIPPLVSEGFVVSWAEAGRRAGWQAWTLTPTAGVPTMLPGMHPTSGKVAPAPPLSCRRCRHLNTPHICP